ncbi:MAG: TatD family hydrolase [Syntrophales bacterium]|nr:TatD family hydrolase [Syntrophales bacterium]
MFIDSHAHLEMKAFDRDRDEVIGRATKAGVDYIVTVGTTLDDCKKAVFLANKYESIYAAVGIHPHEVKNINNATYDSLKELAAHDKVVAYGEIGLDFFRNLSPRDVQIKRFGEQLELAGEIGLPVVIHDREAHRETLDMLQKWKGNQRGIFHCFSGNYEMARKCLDMGFFISIPGTITFKKSETLQKVVENIPITSLLLETDSPYLAPHPRRGKRNEPANVILTARRVAEIKGLPLEEVGKITSQNTKIVFGIT